MKTTYRFNGADFVGLGHRAYQCEIIEVDEVSGFEKPAFVAWGKTREEAIESANHLITSLTVKPVTVKIDTLIKDVHVNDVTGVAQIVKTALIKAIETANLSL